LAYKASTACRTRPCFRKCATPANGVLEWSSQEAPTTPEEVK
jgi:hypothetical protein